MDVVQVENGPFVVGVQGGELDSADSSGSNALAVDNSELLGLRGVDLLEVFDVGADVLAGSAVHHEQWSRAAQVRSRGSSGSSEVDVSPASDALITT
eukprot:4106981-Pyramimonas_sp.AAC.1